MKPNSILFVMAVLFTGNSLARGQPLAELARPELSTVLVRTNERSPANSGLQAPSPAAVPEPGTNASAGGGQKENNGLRLNFRGAPLEMVLDYLSEAAGFIIVLEAQPKGTVDVWSDQPLTRDEACDVLNSALIKNGYAAVRKGRTLTIVNRDEAKTHALPVKLGSDPGSIPQTDEMVTQILPVRFIEVAQLVKDLQPLVSARATMTANESANTVAITETQANIHRVAEIIQ
ncbi:MAG TPA: secretin N-terminal domain-containing protein, partial [Candidatus Sulfotelmatobacter sp.]|nr:secretin N-terminal domain-containing protein [Candidatus Sulfotelmatobacter sp.]